MQQLIRSSWHFMLLCVFVRLYMNNTFNFIFLLAFCAVLWLYVEQRVFGANPLKFAAATCDVVTRGSNQEQHHWLCCVGVDGVCNIVCAYQVSTADACSVVCDDQVRWCDMSDTTQWVDR